MTVRTTVIDIVSKRAQGRMLIVPSLAMRAGMIVRPSPFSSADSVFVGSPSDVAQKFLEHTPAHVFHLYDVDGAAASEPSVTAARAVLNLGTDVTVLVEGGLADQAACVRVASAGLRPIANEEILSTLSDAGAEELLKHEILFGLRGDSPDISTRLARALELGMAGVVHHSSDPGVSIQLGRMVGQVMAYFSREPAASPSEVEDVIAHHGALFRGGVAAAIVDGEWYLDYNTMNEPFDLMR